MLVHCPSCRSGLQVPEGTSGLVRCPTCKFVFSAETTPLLQEPVRDEVQEKQIHGELETPQKTITCPTCHSGLQVPADTMAMIRCPACKSVFSASSTQSTVEKEVERVEEDPPEPEQKLILCPTCQSGLQVPAGTTAMIRCPACKSVFSPAEAARPPDDPRREVSKTSRSRSRPARKARDYGGDSGKKNAKVKKTEDTAVKRAPAENRDFDPDSPKKKAKKRKIFDNEEMSAGERAELRAAFNRAAWGAKLIWISIVLFMLSMMLIVAFYFQATFNYSNPAFAYGAGMMGILNWVLGAIGVGLCLSGPPSKGHWGYGISAAVATGLHLLLLLIMVAKTKDYFDSLKNNYTEAERGGVRWAVVSTRLDMITFYLAYLVYRGEQQVVPDAAEGVGLACGIMEMVRMILIMMLLSCLAQAAGDDDLSQFCTRAGGTASFSPGALSIVILIYAVFVIETRAEGVFIRIIFMVLYMGIYAILAGFMLRAMMAARATADACEEPYQSQYLMI